MIVIKLYDIYLSLCVDYNRPRQGAASFLSVLRPGDPSNIPKTMNQEIEFVQPTSSGWWFSHPSEKY